MIFHISHFSSYLMSKVPIIYDIIFPSVAIVNIQVFEFLLPIELSLEFGMQNRNAARTIAILGSLLEIGISVVIEIERNKNQNISVTGNKWQCNSKDKRRAIF